MFSHFIGVWKSTGELKPAKWAPAGGKFGNITIQNGLTGKALEETVRHEGVHRFFSPKSGPLLEMRANIGIWGYTNSHLIRYTEEALAETIGTGSIRKGLVYPLKGGYDLLPARIIAEGGGYMVLVGGSLYAAYEWSRN
jgi:hypothetical protein